MRIPSLAFLEWIGDEWVGDAANLAQLVAVALAIPAAFWAYRQLKSATASAESQAILALDAAFGQFEDLRKELNTGAFLPKAGHVAPVDDDKRVQLRRYVAVFERLGLLLQKRVVGAQLADQLYGSRFQSLLTKNGGELNKILSERDGKGWENFVYLWKTLRMEASHRNLPDPSGALVDSGTGDTRAFPRRR